MNVIVEPAPAKINLTLAVRGRRPDGYHDIESIVAFADFGDCVTLRLRPSAHTRQAASLTVTGPFSGAITGENLVDRALRMVEQAAACSLAADLELDKRVPVASGIGGGSSDAAAALRAIRSAFPNLVPGIDWVDIATRLGADVPVCLANRPALISGRGEHLQPLSLPSLAIVLANAGMPVPIDKTRRVFEALAAAPSTPRASTAVPIDLGRADLLVRMRDVGNDLEAAATCVFPAIAGVKAAVAATRGCEIAQLSGAGPTVVGVYLSAADADAAARDLRRSHPDWWVRAGTTPRS